MSTTHQTQGREEEADADLRSTHFSKGAAWALTGLFLATIVGVPLLSRVAPPISAEGTPPLPSSILQAGPVHAEAPHPGEKRLASKPGSPVEQAEAWWRSQGWKKIPKRVPSVPSQGELSRIETNLEDDSAVSQIGRPLVQQALTGYLHEGNEQVLVGQDGWLFYRVAANHLTGPGFLTPEHLQRRLTIGRGQPDVMAALRDFHRQLEARGIKLMVMPIPVKATIYPEKLWPAYFSNPNADPTPQNSSFEKFKSLLEADGILVYDATATMARAKRWFKSPIYFPGDSHWTPAAVEIVAQDAASMISMFAGLPPRKPGHYSKRFIRASDPGDLVRLLGLPTDQSLFHPQKVIARQVLADGVPYTAPVGADVLLVGDSYSGAYKGSGAGLAAQLAYYLKRPVEQVGVPNGGSYLARLKLRQDAMKGRDHLAGKKLVVYEFTARDLSLGDWRLIPMPAPSAPSSTRVASQAAARVPSATPLAGS